MTDFRLILLDQTTYVHVSVILFRCIDIMSLVLHVFYTHVRCLSHYILQDLRQGASWQGHLQTHSWHRVPSWQPFVHHNFKGVSWVASFYTMFLQNQAMVYHKINQRHGHFTSEVSSNGMWHCGIRLMFDQNNILTILGLPLAHRLLVHCPQTLVHSIP